MNDCKGEDALCNNAQNHRQQLLNHQQEIDRDIEAGSCTDDEDEETCEEGAEGEEGEDGEEQVILPPQKVYPPVPVLYRRVDNGCTALGCYASIITLIIMVIGIIALLMYSSPGNARAPNVIVKTASSNETLPLTTTEPELTTQ